jgi:hypothetical protein
VRLPCGLLAPSSVRARSATRLDVAPLVSHIFWPVITYSSPFSLFSSRAAVRIAATSEPRSGSDMESALRISPVAIRGRK